MENAQPAPHRGRAKSRLELTRANVLLEQRHRDALRRIAWEDGTTESAALRVVIDKGLAAIEAGR